jgi:hypothetical protein
MPQRNALSPDRQVNALAENANDLTSYIMQARRFGLNSIENPLIRQNVAKRLFGDFNSREPMIKPNMSMYGASGSQVAGEHSLDTPYVMPDMLHSRLGVEGRLGPGRLSGGASGALIRMPDGTVRPYSGSFDAGYAIPIKNGEVSFAASTPIEPVMGSRPVYFNANFRKRF